MTATSSREGASIGSSADLPNPTSFDTCGNGWEAQPYAHNWGSMLEQSDNAQKIICRRGEDEVLMILNPDGKTYMAALCPSGFVPSLRSHQYVPASLLCYRQNSDSTVDACSLEWVGKCNRPEHLVPVKKGQVSYDIGNPAQNECWCADYTALDRYFARAKSGHECCE
jgi:hypothetical protein